MRILNFFVGTLLISSIAFSSNFKEEYDLEVSAYKPHFNFNRYELNKVYSMTSDKEIEPIKTDKKIKEKKLKKKKDKTDKVLLKTSKVDNDYKGKVIKLSKNDRYILERLVMGEAGNQGFEGAALVAQTIRDTMVYKDIDTVEEVRIKHKYSGSLKYEPNEDVLKAVKFIFDEGGCAVKHRLLAFYAPGIVKSSWHEAQDFIIEYKDHRFFNF